MLRQDAASEKLDESAIKVALLEAFKKRLHDEMAQKKSLYYLFHCDHLINQTIYYFPLMQVENSQNYFLWRDGFRTDDAVIYFGTRDKASQLHQMITADDLEKSNSFTTILTNLGGFLHASLNYLKKKYGEPIKINVTFSPLWELSDNGNGSLVIKLPTPNEAYSLCDKIISDGEKKKIPYDATSFGLDGVDPMLVGYPHYLYRIYDKPTIINSEDEITAYISQHISLGEFKPTPKPPSPFSSPLFCQNDSFYGAPTLLSSHQNLTVSTKKKDVINIFEAIKNEEESYFNHDTERSHYYFQQLPNSGEKIIYYFSTLQDHRNMPVLWRLNEENEHMYLYGISPYSFDQATYLQNVILAQALEKGITYANCGLSRLGASIFIAKKQLVAIFGEPQVITLKMPMIWHNTHSYRDHSEEFSIHCTTEAKAKELEQSITDCAKQKNITINNQAEIRLSTTVRITQTNLISIYGEPVKVSFNKKPHDESSTLPEYILAWDHPKDSLTMTLCVKKNPLQAKRKKSEEDRTKITIATVRSLQISGSPVYQSTRSHDATNKKNIHLTEVPKNKI